ASVTENVKAVAKAKNKSVEEVTVTLLKRDRNQHIIDEVRELGARIKFVDNGDVAAAINTCFDYTGVDNLIGSGGVHEVVLAAFGIKSLGGALQGRRTPKSDEELARSKEMGVDHEKKCMLDDLVKGDDAIFAATAVPDGELMKGVQFKGDYVNTSSV